MKNLLTAILVLLVITSAFAADEVNKWNGKIDRITNNEIVINDFWFPLTANIRYLNKDGTEISRSWFIVGKEVVAEIGANKEIRTLYLDGKKK